ncbi:IS1096 element passenger TnpR family protein [Paraburkholderia dipogonis]|uniref:IS1096 element passenger TnpR family protein n=1 Tax=Paraburkholderia dipogonis TaxID=1211383 RepID=UPI00360FFF0A
MSDPHGKNACPPEDVGGLPGYADIVEAIDNPTHMCVFRRNVAGRFGIMTGGFGNVTGRVGGVTERTLTGCAHLTQSLIEDSNPLGNGMEERETLKRAATWLREADGLIVTAGAGTGVDSGLPDFVALTGLRTYPALKSHRLTSWQIHKRCLHS